MGGITSLQSLASWEVLVTNLRNPTPLTVSLPQNHCQIAGLIWNTFSFDSEPIYLFTWKWNFTAPQETQQPLWRQEREMNSSREEKEDQKEDQNNPYSSEWQSVLFINTSHELMHLM